MKILAFSDTHLNKSCIQKIKKKAKKVDILVCAGDVSLMGMGLATILKDLNRIKKPIYIIPGNHEEPPTKLRNYCKKLKYLIYSHKKAIKIGEFTFFFWGCGGFALNNPHLEKAMHKFKKRIKKGEQIIFITHGPPHKTKLDYLDWAGHVGCKSIRKFIREIKPVLHISGHIHENMKKKEVLFKKTLIVNPGPDGMILEV
jgi:uncharacterized protein